MGIINILINIKKDAGVHHTLHPDAK